MTDIVSNELANQIFLLREKKETLSMEDLQSVLEKVAAMLNTKTSVIEEFLRDEMVKIARHIDETKKEILALSPDGTSGQDIGSANVQLDAVLKSTEEAAQTIMDATDEIQEVIAESSASPEVKDKISTISLRIFEACNFQDLTGQRITKVMQALEFTESHIKRLTSLFASDGSFAMEEFKKITVEKTDLRPDSHLLNGPQLPGNSPSQSDIDAMFG